MSSSLYNVTDPDRTCGNNSPWFCHLLFISSSPNQSDQIAAAVIAGAMAIAPAAFAADLENGAQVFAGNCAACHAGGNNVIQNEKVDYSGLTFRNISNQRRLLLIYFATIHTYSDS